MLARYKVVSLSQLRDCRMGHLQNNGSVEHWVLRFVSNGINKKMLRTSKWTKQFVVKKPVKGKNRRWSSKRLDKLKAVNEVTVSNGNLSIPLILYMYMM